MAKKKTWPFFISMGKRPSLGDLAAYTAEMVKISERCSRLPDLAPGLRIKYWDMVKGGSRNKG